MGCGAVAWSRRGAASKRYAAFHNGEGSASSSCAQVFSGTAEASDAGRAEMAGPSSSSSQTFAENRTKITPRRLGGPLGGPLVCISADAAHEAVGRGLVDELTRCMRSSARLLPLAGGAVDELRADLSLLGSTAAPGTGARQVPQGVTAPACEVLVPLLTPEWLRASAGTSTLRSALRLRALSLGPQLLPLVHVAAFGSQPDAISKALNAPMGALLREAAAPGSWGRLDGGTRAMPASGVKAAAAWLTARVETLVCPPPASETSARLQRDAMVSWRRRGRGPERVQGTEQAPAAASELSGVRQTPIDPIETEISRPGAKSEHAKDPVSPARPSGMPRLSQERFGGKAFTVADRDEDMLSACDVAGEHDVEAVLKEALKEHLLETASPSRPGSSAREQRRPSLGPMREATAATAEKLSRPGTASRPDNVGVAAAQAPSDQCPAEPTVRISTACSSDMVSTAIWADALRNELGAREPALGRTLAGVGHAPAETKAPVPTRATPSAWPLLPPQPRSPKRRLPGRLGSKAFPWRPEDGDGVSNALPKPNSGWNQQCSAESGGSSSAPPTPRGREEGWDHFLLRGELEVAWTINDLSISAIRHSISAPSSPRETVYSLTQSYEQLFSQTLGRTCWGTTSNWVDIAKNSSKAFGSSQNMAVPEEDLWEALEECQDFAGQQPEEQEAVLGKRRRPMAPQGMPPLPVSTMTGFQTTLLASTTANPFGAGLWPSESGDPAVVEGHFGRFVLGAPMPALGGGGAFGHKFAALDCNLHRRVALWHYRSPSEEVAMTEKASIRDAVAAEVEKLRELRHPRLCPYLASERSDGELYVILGFAPGGSVADWLHDAGPIGEAPAQRVLCAVLQGLAFLHGDAEIVHGAVHGGNVLLGPGAAVRLADFGLSPIRSASTERRRLAGGSMLARLAPEPSPGALPLLGAALPWLAPELADNGVITRPSDIWGLGCLTVEMLCGYLPQGGIDMTAFVTAATPNCGVSTSLPLPQSASATVKRCLVADPVGRASATELLDDPWLVTAR